MAARARRPPVDSLAQRRVAQIRRQRLDELGADALYEAACEALASSICDSTMKMDSPILSVGCGTSGKGSLAREARHMCWGVDPNVSKNR